MTFNQVDATKFGPELSKPLQNMEEKNQKNNVK